MTNRTYKNPTAPKTIGAVVEVMLPVMMWAFIIYQFYVVTGPKSF